MAFLGICGRNRRPCQLSWANTFGNKVGTFPSKLLPAKRTTWYGGADAYFSFSPPLITPGDSFGLPLLGGLTGLGFGVTQFDTFNTKTHFTLVFAETVNRLNVPYTLTEEDLETYAETGDGIFLGGTKGTILIDFGKSNQLPNEYIFNVIGVTDRDDVVVLDIPIKIICPRYVRKSHRPNDTTSTSEGEKVRFTLEAIFGEGRYTFSGSATGPDGQALPGITKNGGFFPVGTSRFTGVVTDEAENRSECTFDISIENISEDDEEYDLMPYDGSNSAEDISFRALSDIDIPEELQRFTKIWYNRRSIEYRLDGERAKTVDILDNNSQSDIRSPTYNDGTSKIIEVDIDKLRIPTEEEKAEGILSRSLLPGDVIYISYVGITKHCIRQRVSVNWAVTAMGLPAPQAYANPVSLSWVNYRFYKWALDKEDPDNEEEQTVTVEGWRAVESFNAKPNFIAKTGKLKTSVLGDFGAGGIDGVKTFEYLPGNVTAKQLDQYISKSSSLPTYAVNFDQYFEGANYHINSSPDYLNAAWNLKAEGSYGNVRYSDAIQHILFNVHPKALKKRDIDKWGIERFIAELIEEDIKSKKPTGVPFMDDPNLDNPAAPAVEKPIGSPETGNPTAGAREYLSSSNCKFEPIEPLALKGLDLIQTDAGTGGGLFLGSGFGGSQVIGVVVVESGIINEPFDPGTRILVERAFTKGMRSSYVAIEGDVRDEDFRSITCVQDPSATFHTVFHNNQDNFLTYNVFSNTAISYGMSKVVYRPDLGYRPATDNPTPDSYDPYLGYSGLLGDAPGYMPGRLVTTSTFSRADKFIIFTTDKTQIHPNFVDQIQTIPDEDVRVEEEKIVITLPASLYASTSVVISGSGYEDNSIMLIGKLSDSITATIDDLAMPEGDDVKLRIDHRWIECDQISIVGKCITDISLKSVVVHSIDQDYADSFLNGEGDTEEKPPEDFYTDRPVLFQSSVMSAAEDAWSNVFIFFNDSDGGISVAVSRDFGSSWVYFYSVIPSMDGENVFDPFVINDIKDNQCFVIYRFAGKLLCKRFAFTEFTDKDAFLVEKNEEVFEPANEENDTPIENAGKYSSRGADMRRHKLSYIVAGDLTDNLFLDYLQYHQVNVYSKTDRTEEIESQVITRSRQPVAVGQSTAFTNRDVDTSFFSGYSKDNGELRVFFLAPVIENIGGGRQLQCHYSIDDGVSWFDLWELQNCETNRVRVDSTTHMSFIDRGLSCELDQIPEDLTGTNPKESGQDYLYGINIHKTTAGDGGEILVNEVEAPYVFYSPENKICHLFYVYEGCLLCKSFDENLFQNTYETMKTSIEDDIKAAFIDGYLYQGTLETEIGTYIYFPYQHAISTFDDTRKISGQRICALSLPNGNIRVFYKHDSSPGLRAAIYNGTYWLIEDLMRSD